LGKGVAAAAIGSLLECCGLKIAMIKCDPYINVDAGNMSPYQHGEVYVTADGSETDSDIGTFSRFTTISPAREHSITTGQIYDEVIKNERAGRYNGRTVQVIPHITDEIKRRILAAGMRSEADVVIVEIGGTVGDIESIPFLEATRQLIRELGHTDAVSILLTLVPVLTGGEMKTKPTQHAVKKMQEIGIQPDILLCRAELPLDNELREKIALFCNVAPTCVFTSADVQKSIYELPVLFHEQGLDDKILLRLGFAGKTVSVRPWIEFLDKLDNPKKRVTVALLVKNDLLNDCYKSIREALHHAAVTSHNAELVITRIDAEGLEKEHDISHFFTDIDGILIPDNYGQRGFLGLLRAVKYAREHKLPYLGIDLGMQLMAIETARSLLKWEDADSTEFIRNTTHPVISLPEEQPGLAASGLIKLGSSAVTLVKGSKLCNIYNSSTISERHRSKYAFNRRYLSDIEAHGLRAAASALDGQIEAFEWEGHPWGIGVQYHPEFVSRPLKPHPLFAAFIGAALQAKI
jgi:CTP synthase